MSPVLARGIVWHDAVSATVTTATTQIDTLAPSQMAPLSRTTDDSSYKPQGIALETKIGLSIVPVVVFLCALWLLFLFWLRKRHTLREIQPMTPRRLSKLAMSTFSESPDSRMTVVEKRYHVEIPVMTKAYDEERPMTARGHDVEIPMTTNISEVDGPVNDQASNTTAPMGGKVCNISAYSQPIPNFRHHERRIIAQAGLRIQTDMSLFEDQVQVEGAIPFFGNFRMTKREQDSPIDGKSPFRLKRGDTQKRDSEASRSSGGSSYTFPFPQPPPAVMVIEARDIGERFPSLEPAHNFSYPRSRTF